MVQRVVPPKHREPAADEDLPIRLYGDGPHEEVRAWIEAGIGRAVGVEPADVEAVAHIDEVAADEDLAIGLQRDHGDSNEGNMGRSEAGIVRAVRVDPVHLPARGRAADQDLPVRLDDQGFDVIVRDGGVEGRVDRLRARGDAGAERDAHNGDEAG